MNNNNFNPINQANNIVSNSIKHASLRSSVRPVVEHLFFNECIKGDFPKVYYGLKTLLPYLTASQYDTLITDARNDEYQYKLSHMSNKALSSNRLKSISHGKVSSFAEDLTCIGKKIFRID